MTMRDKAIRKANILSLIPEESTWPIDLYRIELAPLSPKDTLTGQVTIWLTCTVVFLGAAFALAGWLVRIGWGLG